jgi:hypothetical protein
MGNWSLAIRLRELLKTFPKSDLTDDAVLHRRDLLHVGGFQDALRRTAVVERYPSSKHAPTSLARMAQKALAIPQAKVALVRDQTYLRAAPPGQAGARSAQRAEEMTVAGAAR